MSPRKFRLISATLRNVPDRPAAQFNLGASGRNQGNDARFTVVVGRNGSGKSRLLSGIAAAFLALEDYQTHPKRRFYQDFPLQELRYEIDDREIHVRIVDNDLLVWIDGFGIPVTKIVLPNRVLALTMSAFDKFPLPRSPKGAPSGTYRYMGLRDRSGRASNTRLLSELASNVFANSESDEPDRRHRIANAMEYLGFEPRMAVEFKVRVSQKVIKELQADGSAATKLSTNETLELERTTRNIREGVNSAVVDRVFKIGSEIAVRGRTVVSANFTNDGSYEEFQDLDVLRRAGLLSISAISVSHRDGPAFDLKDASSGEQTMLASFVGLAATLDSGSLILIDEPETSLHPQWQTDFVAQLVARFSQFSGCEYLIATHSPLIISDLPAGTEIASLDHWSTQTGVQLAGASSDLILAELFRSPGRKNLFVRDELARAFRILAQDREAPSWELAAIQSRLRTLVDSTPAGDPSIPVIRELLTLRPE